MEAYGTILIIAMPLFLLFVLLEKAYGWYVKRDPFRHMDTVSSLSSGLSNVLKDVLGLSVSIISYAWMVEHLAVWRIEATIWVYLIAFLVLDFSGYLVHWMSHKVNVFWNKHLIHHSSEEFNLACALRQSVSVFVQLFTFFLLPAAFFGVPVEVIAIVAPLHLFAQFWYHTVYIGRMGFLEHLIVTPSHHRVHHAINPVYLDKNFGQIFIFWDKLFGTFQEEMASEPPVYGITRPVRTWNPLKINFQHLALLFRDAWYTRRWYDKLRIWFMPTGWRPADVEERFPVYYIEDIYNFEKYNPPVSTQHIVWSWVQFFVAFGLMVYLFTHLVAIGSPGIFVYGGFLFFHIFSFTELMDRHALAPWWELAKNALGVYLLYSTAWFGLAELWPSLGLLLASYFLVASVLGFALQAPVGQGVGAES